MLLQKTPCPPIASVCENPTSLGGLGNPIPPSPPLPCTTTTTAATTTATIAAGGKCSIHTGTQHYCPLSTPAQYPHCAGRCANQFSLIHRDCNNGRSSHIPLACSSRGPTKTIASSHCNTDTTSYNGGRCTGHALASSPCPRAAIKRNHEGGYKKPQGWIERSKIEMELNLPG